MTNRIDQPRQHDLVDDVILVGGIGTGFEATLNFRVHDGHDEVTGFFNVGGGTGEHAQFQLQVNVAGAAFILDRVFVEIFERSAEDGSEINKVMVPVVLGARIVPGYFGFREHTVQAGRHAVRHRRGQLRRRVAPSPASPGPTPTSSRTPS